MAQGIGFGTPDPDRWQHAFPGKTWESCGRAVLGASPKKVSGVAKTCHWAEGVAGAQRGKTIQDERRLLALACGTPVEAAPGGAAA